MRAIVAVDKNWAIGKNNELLFHIKEDLKRFKSLTIGKAVVMGRKTFESLPGKKPLQGRDNFILTRDENYHVDGAIVVHSYYEFLSKYASEYLPCDIYVIGGSEIYKLFLDSIDEIYVTKVNKIVEDADKFFPNLDELYNWEVFADTDVFTDDSGIDYKYVIYRNK